MPRSYAQQAEAHCPACGQPMHLEIWLIIDLVERPDLAARIRQGTLHTVHCPHCGHAPQLGTPLLVHDPIHQRLLFIPPQNSSASEHRELASVLAARLAEVFPGSHAKYLSQATRTPLESLTELIDVGELPQARGTIDEEASPGLPPLVATLQAFVQADPWSAPQQMLQKNPELLSDETDVLLEQFIQAAQLQGDEGAGSFFEEHREPSRCCQEPSIGAALSAEQGDAQSDRDLAALEELTEGLSQAEEAEAHYACTGDLRALDTGCSVWQRIWAHPAFETTCPIFRLVAMNDGGRMFLHRYWARGRDEDLTIALHYFEQAVQVSPPGSPDRPMYLSNLGTGLRSRYERTGELADLERAIEAHEQAVQATPLGSPDRPFRLGNLGTGLRDRYRHTGELADLEQAIEAHEQAVQASPPGSPDRPRCLNNLGVGLSDRYERTGGLADLEQAIGAYEQAVQAMPLGSPDRSMYLSNLGTGLRDRYRRTGELIDLERSIEAHEQAVQAMPPNSPNRPGPLNNLGNGLRDRYRRAGELTDLERAIGAYEQAVQATPPNSPDRPFRLGNLGNGLLDRYECTGELIDLERAIEAYEQAVQAMPLASPGRPRCLNNLGNGLRDRYERTGELADLERAVGAYEQAVQSSPPGSPDRPRCLNNLGNGLRDRYRRTGELADLERAVEAHEQAVQAMPPNSPFQPGPLNNLGNGLRDRYERTGEAADLERATQVYEQACQRGVDVDLETALRAARNWGDWATKRAVWSEAARALNYGLQAADRLFEAQILRGSKETWLHEVRGLHAGAAYAKARAGDLQGAVVALETGRARLLAQALERDRADLEHLKRIDESLYQRYAAAAGWLRALERSELSGSSALPPGQSMADVIREARTAMDQAIKAIRCVDGYQDFLAAPTFAQIQAVAKVDCPLVYLAVTEVGSVLLIVASRGKGRHDAASPVRVVWSDLKQAELAGLLASSQGDGFEGYLPAQMGLAAMAQALECLLPVLGERLMAPLAQELRSLAAQRVVLVPSGLLSLVPLGAAPVGPQPFLDALEVSYSPSALALAHSRRRLNDLTKAPAQNGLLAVGDPPHDGALRLPSALAEVEDIAPHYARGSCQLLVAEQARKEAVLARAPMASCLHFACHGEFDLDDPLSSALLLTGKGKLTARDLLTGELVPKARLAVLSACRTAITDFGNLPDEALGLPAAFLAAGVPGVIGSLWSVGDISTALLMERFHFYLRREGLTPPAALRAAQQWLRDVTNVKLWSFLRARRQQSIDCPRLYHGSAYQDLFIRVALAPNDQPYAAPRFWAAFTFQGA